MRLVPTELNGNLPKFHNITSIWKKNVGGGGICVLIKMNGIWWNVQWLNIGSSTLIFIENLLRNDQKIGFCWWIFVNSIKSVANIFFSLALFQWFNNDFIKWYCYHLFFDKAKISNNWFTFSLRSIFIEIFYYQ